ncbi:ATP-binding protein [Streptomyces sp. NPDC001107]
MTANGTPAFTVTGIPRGADDMYASVLRTQLITAMGRFSSRHGTGPLAVTVTNQPSQEAGTPEPDGSGPHSDVLSIEERASYFTAIDPEHTFDRLVLPEAAVDRLLRAVDIVERRHELFDVWGLRAIEPHPSSAINLYGPPGTGKTLAAHAVAARLGRRIIAARASQLESKYHGEGPKNLDALFHAAAAQRAVLFVDEADSLMSARFEATSHGSEQAVNAMRSELITALDRFEGLVLFATNFVTSYDTAFDSRLWQVHFPPPDVAARTEIWRRHLPAALPLAPDVSPQALAAIDDVVGRDICRAVIDAAADALHRGDTRIGHADLVAAVERIKAARPDRTLPQPPSGGQISPAES